MRGKVVSPFVDKFNSRVTYLGGEVIEVDEARAADLIGRSLAEPVTESEVKPKAEPKVETADKTGDVKADTKPESKKKRK